LAEALALAEGRLDPKAAAHRAADRRPLIEAWAREREPAVLEEYAGHRQARAETPPPTTGAHWPATALSQGLATGRARIARRPTDALDLEDGDILVAPATDPAWTPLFLKAGGVILETGGYLSHGAIVAREFGIPAVANLAGVLDRLTDGALVTVDGDRGRVILGETKDPP
jgi:pyruvate,water dikinase